MGYLTLCRAMRTDGVRCGAMTSDRRGYCDEHRPFGARMRASPEPPSRRTYRWRKLSQSFLRDWVREHGWLCAGWKRAPHAVIPPRPGDRSPLHADHVVSLSKGGAEFDRANLQALCAKCNGRKAGHGS